MSFFIVNQKMNERPPDSMLSFVADTLCCELKEKFIFAMPRVVPDQRTTFENDELFRKLSRECEVRYTGFRDRPMDERQLRFQAECREGHADVAFVCTGTTLQLNFSANSWSDRPEDRVLTREYVDFDSEPGKVHLKSQFILNGVCVLWRGYIDLVRLDGVASLEFDRERAEVEDSLLREQVEQNSRRVQEFEDRRRQQHQLDQERNERQERQASSEAETRSGRRKNRSRRDINIPIFISTHHHNMFHQHRNRISGISSGTIDNNRNSNCTNMNLNNNNNSIINSINSLHSHIINNPHLHGHYHPHFRHHHHHRRHHLCDCGLTLQPSSRSRPARSTEDARSPPSQIPEDLSSPSKGVQRITKDPDALSPVAESRPWKERHKDSEQAEEEIEIDVVEVDADPESDIDIEGEGDVDRPDKMLAAKTVVAKDKGDIPKTCQDGDRTLWRVAEDQESSSRPERQTSGKGDKGEVEAAQTETNTLVKSERRKKMSSRVNCEEIRSSPKDVDMEDVTEFDSRMQEGGDPSRAEHARSPGVGTEAGRIVDAAPREADNTATARDKIRKSDTIWSPWK